MNVRDNEMVDKRSGFRKTILIVEDDLVNARVFSRIYTRLGGFNCIHSEDVGEIICLVESGKIDVVQMDVSLASSIYDGIKITQILKANPATAHVPIFLCTAHAMEGDREQFLAESGADGYVSKPVEDHFGLINLIKSLLKPSISKKNFLSETKNLKLSDQHRPANKTKSCSSLTLDVMKTLCADVSHSLRGEIMHISSSVDEIEYLMPENDFVKMKLEIVSSSLKVCSNKLKALSRHLERLDESESSDPEKTLEEKEKEVRSSCSFEAESLMNAFIYMDGLNREIHDLPDVTDEVKEECKYIMRCIDYGQARLQKLLNYFELKEIPIEQINISLFFEELQEMINSRIPCEISLRFLIESDVQTKCMLGNTDQLRNILIELFRNSHKAILSKSLNTGSKRGGYCFSIGVYEKDGEHIRISIKDNGPGIKKNLQDQLFKGYVKSSYGGSGMGLYLSNQLIQQMGGRLSLFSSEKGTEIEIFLRAEQCASPSQNIS